MNLQFSWFYFFSLWSYFFLIEREWRYILYSAGYISSWISFFRFEDWSLTLPNQTCLHLGLMKVRSVYGISQIQQHQVIFLLSGYKITRLQLPFWYRWCMFFSASSSIFFKPLIAIKGFLKPAEIYLKYMSEIYKACVICNPSWLSVVRDSSAVILVLHKLYMQS